MARHTAQEKTPEEPPAITASDFACFEDAKGRVFTLKVPYGEMLRLKASNLEVNFIGDDAVTELGRVTRDWSLLYSVIVFLVGEQLAAQDIDRETWQDDLFVSAEDDEDNESPSILEAMAAALEAVVTGFIPNASDRRTVRRSLKLQRDSLTVMRGTNDDDVASVSPERFGGLMMEKINGGKSMDERLKEAVESTPLSGTAPDDSESPPTDTRSDA